MGDRWIEVVGWEEFQHYRDRDPVWIKNYTRLLSLDAYRGLTFHQRGVIHSLWLEYARGQRQLRDNTLTLSRQLGQRVLTRDLEALNHAGFIRFRASKPLARRYRSASPEKEVLRTSFKEDASRSLARGGGGASKKNSEPDRDPEALSKIRKVAEATGLTS